MAQDIVIRCTAIDPGGLRGVATKTIRLDGRIPPPTTDPEIISFTATENPIAPGATTEITVVGRNYDRVIWDGPGLSATTTPEMRTFTAPENVTVGTPYVISVTLADDFDSDTGSITITIRNVAPIINSLTGIPTSIGVNDSFEAFVNATDANGDSLRYEWASPDFRQGISPGSPVNAREFQAPRSILGAFDAVKTITCRVEDILPQPHISDSDTESRNVIIDPDAPNSPNIMGVRALRTQITMDWDPPTDNGGSPITGYRVWIRRLEVDATDDPAQDWSLSRSVIVSGTIHQFIFDSPSFSIIPSRNYEVGVTAFNTFDINGITYGGISERRVARVTTDVQFVPPMDIEPEENYPPTVEILTTGHTIQGEDSVVIRKTQDILVVSFSGIYSDVDGDALTVYWSIIDISDVGAVISFGEIENPYEGTTTVQVYLDQNIHPGNFFLILNAYDNVSNDESNPSSDSILVTVNVS